MPHPTDDHATLQALLAATLAAHLPHSPDSPAPDSHAPAPLAVLCLCAAWCGACREWRAVFDAAARAHPALAFRWVDVEDEADALGELDVDTFPTLVIGDARGPRFHGPVLPQPGQIERLLRTLGGPDGTPPPPR